MRPAGLILWLFAASAVAATSCGGGNVDVKTALQVTDVTTGWFDNGVQPGGGNKLTPSVSFKLKNIGTGPISSVFLTAVFRRVYEQEVLSDAWVRGVDSSGLAPGSETQAIVLRSNFGYTGQQPRSELLQHKDFKDAKVELFAKQGSANPAKIAEFVIARQLLTR